jgi:hypothetical protein
MDTWDEYVRRAEPSALLTPDGIIRSLNVSMATALGRPAEQCVGHDFRDLLPESQRFAAESLLTHGATTNGSPGMSVGAWVGSRRQCADRIG